MSEWRIDMQYPGFEFPEEDLSQTPAPRTYTPTTNEPSSGTTAPYQAYEPLQNNIPSLLQSKTGEATQSLKLQQTTAPRKQTEELASFASSIYTDTPSVEAIQPEAIGQQVKKTHSRFSKATHGIIDSKPTPNGAEQFRKTIVDSSPKKTNGSNSNGGTQKHSPLNKQDTLDYSPALDMDEKTFLISAVGEFNIAAVKVLQKVIEYLINHPCSEENMALLIDLFEKSYTYSKGSMNESKFDRAIFEFKKAILMLKALSKDEDKKNGNKVGLKKEQYSLSSQQMIGTILYAIPFFQEIGLEQN